MFRIQFACAALARREAEADFISALATEARASAERAKTEARQSAETAKALVQTILRRKSEALTYERYYRRLYQVAATKVAKATKDATYLQEHGKELGLILSPVGKMNLIILDGHVNDLSDGTPTDIALFGED